MGRNFDDYPSFQPKITPPKHFSRQCITSDKAYDIFSKLYGIFEKQTYSLFWLFQGLGRDGLLEEAQCKALGTGVCLARRQTVAGN